MLHWWCHTLTTRLTDRQSDIPFCERAASSRCPSCPSCPSCASSDGPSCRNPDNHRASHLRKQTASSQTCCSCNSNRVKVSLATMLKSSHLFPCDWRKVSVIQAKVLQHVMIVVNTTGAVMYICSSSDPSRVSLSKWLLGKSWPSDCDSPFNLCFLKYNYKKKYNSQETRFKSTFPSCLPSSL